MDVQRAKMLNDNPILQMLGRRGRGAVVEALRRNPRRAWGIRDIARLADVSPMTASRAVRELETLGAVSVRRQGRRDAQVRFLPQSVAGTFLATVDAPDLGRRLS